jgi:tRNA threonylcarbamoyladenosine biosynthesis protein TsaB
MVLKILSLDTATPRGSVALLEDRCPVAELRLLSLETHSARLLGSVAFLLKSLDWQLGDLELIVAGIGPGSFTGMRIGIASAIGLAQTLGIPFAGVSGLDAMARQLPGIDGRVGVVMDAQRSQVYYAEYRGRQGRISRIGSPLLLNPPDLERRIRRSNLYLVGDGAQRYGAALGISRSGWPRFVEVDLFLAAALGRLALARRQTWRRGRQAFAEPLYIRPADAQKRKAEKR